MNHKKFIAGIDQEAVVREISAAEKRTSGEIRVWVSSRAITGAMQSAQARFDKLGMRQTAERNAVLLYIAPRSRVFAIIGDQGIHEKCGDAFWQEVSAQFSTDLKTGPATQALIRAIAKIGDLLTTHFPRKPGDKNELPDAVIGD